MQGKLFRPFTSYKYEKSLEYWFCRSFVEVQRWELPRNLERATATALFPNPVGASKNRNLYPDFRDWSISSRTFFWLGRILSNGKKLIRDIERIDIKDKRNIKV